MKDTIILHHSASTSPDPQYDDIVRFHNNGANGKIRAGRGMAYHYFIGRDGTVKQAHSEEFVCDNSGNFIMNMRSIAICLAGDFRTEIPTNAQMETFTNLVTDIQCRWGIPDERIILHKEVTAGHTVCPVIDLQRMFFDYRFQKMLERIPQIQNAIRHARGSRKIFLSRLLDRLQKLTPIVSVPT